MVLEFPKSKLQMFISLKWAFTESIFAHSSLQRLIGLHSRLNVLDVCFWRVASAYRASFDIRQVKGLNIAMHISLRCSLHKPVSIYAQSVESVEAAVDSDEVDAVCELLRLSFSLILTERLEADGATPLNRVIVVRKAVTQTFIHLVQKSIGFRLVSFFVAELLQTIDDVAFQHIDLVIIESLRCREFELRRLFRELRVTNNKVGQIKNRCEKGRQCCLVYLLHQ